MQATDGIAASREARLPSSFCVASLPPQVRYLAAPGLFCSGVVFFG
jgi:hypothetical protein